jgi:hypothetical protein
VEKKLEYSVISKRILDKIDSLTENKSEQQMCKKILVYENQVHNVADLDFKERYKKILNDCFPYDGKN